MATGTARRLLEEANGTDTRIQDGHRLRVAHLLRIVSQATADLAAEFDRSDPPAPGPVRTRRRRPRAIAVPQDISDLDVQAARRALRRAGL